MEAVLSAGTIYDILGQDNTNIGKMFDNIRRGMKQIENDSQDVYITDILAVDTLAPVLISGALAGETCLEKAVGVAAMVKTQQLPMKKIAEKLEEELHTKVVVAGVEAIMASIGALTTPGTKLPLAIVDMGGGSTDAAVINEDGKITITHKAGAGELVSMLIQTELGLSDRHIAEQIKKYPLAKVESLFHMRMENGQITFVEDSIDPRFYGRVVLLTDSGLVRIEEDIPMEKIVQVRREAKQKVFVTNAIRALTEVAPGKNLKKISNIVLVGGSAADFEIPELLMEEFSKYMIVCGRGNIRGTEGPRNAVATGLVLSHRE
jgi:diol dehydratase reactivase alpha subunit